jgi:hypothetical protein
LKGIQGIRADRVAIRLATVYYCAKPFIASIKVNAPPLGVLADVFGTDIFH